jgi:hypothetical protein
MIYILLVISLVISITILSRFKDDVCYFRQSLALGDHNLDSSTNDLFYINWDCLSHLRVKREQAKHTQ